MPASLPFIFYGVSLGGAVLSVGLPFYLSKVVAKDTTFSAGESSENETWKTQIAESKNLETLNKECYAEKKTEDENDSPKFYICLGQLNSQVSDTSHNLENTLQIYEAEIWSSTGTYVWQIKEFDWIDREGQKYLQATFTNEFESKQDKVPLFFKNKDGSQFTSESTLDIKQSCSLIPITPASEEKSYTFSCGESEWKIDTNYERITFPDNAK